MNNFVFTAQIGLALDTYSFADRLGIDRVALAQVLAHGSGGSRAAAIVAASGFDTTGMRQHAGVLRKDVGIMLDVARAAGAAEPASIVELAQTALVTLESAPGGDAGQPAGVSNSRP